MSFLKWAAVRLLALVVGLVILASMAKFWGFVWRHCPGAADFVEWCLR